jgi:mRNA-degrading endonuclease RelE of RelBE toxin-antitoxin system
MNLKIVNLKSFTKDIKRLYKKYKSIASDLKSLQSTLLDNPKAGISLGDNLYKIRLANSSIPTGKSGGFRVIYYYLNNQNNLYLMSIYSKTELENINEEKLIDILKNNEIGL